MSCTKLKWSEDIRYLKSNSYLIPEAGGLYKVLRNDREKGKLTRVYVGKAANLHSQYERHLSDYEENVCLKNNIRNRECYFRYSLLDGENNRQEAENHLLETGKYECNIRGQ